MLGIGPQIGLIFPMDMPVGPMDFVLGSNERPALRGKCNAIEDKLTEKLGIEHPILLAPMHVMAGGKLAAAVSDAGGLGFIDGGYGDPDWLEL